MSELQGELDRLERLLVETIALSTPQAATTGNSTITVNAGGAGVWIAATCCIVSFVINVCLGFVVVMHDRKIDDLNAYVTAIYAMAPSLKPEGK